MTKITLNANEALAIITEALSTTSYKNCLISQTDSGEFAVKTYTSDNKDLGKFPSKEAAKAAVDKAFPNATSLPNYTLRQRESDESAAISASLKDKSDFYRDWDARKSGRLRKEAVSKDKIDCPNCDGTGQVEASFSNTMIDNDDELPMQKCRVCAGSGKISINENALLEAKGYGTCWKCGSIITSSEVFFGVRTTIEYECDDCGHFGYTSHWFKTPEAAKADAVRPAKDLYKEARYEVVKGGKPGYWNVIDNKATVNKTVRAGITTKSVAQDVADELNDSKRTAAVGWVDRKVERDLKNMDRTGWVSEAIQNPNSSGQGKDPEFKTHPWASTVMSAGYAYSHSTPVIHLGNNRIIHHTFQMPGTEHKVSLWTDFEPYTPKHFWETSVSSASGRRETGTDSGALWKHLSSKDARYGFKKIQKPSTSQPYGT